MVIFFLGHSGLYVNIIYQSEGTRDKLDAWDEMLGMLGMKLDAWDEMLGMFGMKLDVWDEIN